MQPGKLYNIYIILYALYKLDWLNTHNITKQREVDTLYSYYQYIEDNDLSMVNYTFDDYLTENGYGGELYCCFDEFCKNEFMDVDYMHSLIGSDKLNILIAYEKELKRLGIEPKCED